MGIFDKIFEKKVSHKAMETKINWLPLTEQSQLGLIENNNEKTSILFKHSTRCIVSKVVLKEIEEKFESLNEDFDFYFLDLLNYRSISSAVAEQFSVQHQSPQLIVVRNGEVVAQDSHYDIVNLELAEYRNL